ncbi:MAG: hypothetical protein U9N43_07780 [Euryarchaeota archaeon]|nr:hypothetical protein [Euryarchaeota archaeon]
MIELDIPQPENDIVRSFEEAIEKGEKIGYPLMVRPSRSWRAGHGGRL